MRRSLRYHLYYARYAVHDSDQLRAFSDRFQHPHPPPVTVNSQPHPSTAHRTLSPCVALLRVNLQRERRRLRTTALSSTPTKCLQQVKGSRRSYRPPPRCLPCFYGVTPGVCESKSRGGGGVRGRQCGVLGCAQDFGGVRPA